MSEPYRIVLESRARKNLARLDPVIRRQISKRIDALASDPEPAGCVALKGTPGALRVRVGDYRIVYMISRTARQLDVIDIDHRRDIYR